MKNLKNIIILSIFIIITCIFFRTYFLNNKVPLPFNLLTSFYSPWKYDIWQGYPFGIPNKPLGNDNLKLFYPFKKFTIEEMKKGNIPLWNPYVFSGNVHHATYQSALFYPLNIAYFFLPLPDAWSLLIILQPILAGWFTYLFMRSLKLSAKASFFGALGFAFSGWMIALWQEVLVIEHSILWLPLALYGSNLIWNTDENKKGFFVLVISFCFSVLAGFPQMIVYLFCTAILWNTYQWLIHKEDKKRSFKLLLSALAIVFTLGITAIQWVPALESYQLSSRAQVDGSYLFQTFLTPLSYLITFIAPDFWGNPGTYNYFSNAVYLQERTLYVSIFIVLFGISFLFMKIKGQANFWKIFTIVTLSMAFALPTSWTFYFLHIPLLSVAMPVRILVLSIFGLCILAAYGFDEFQKRNLDNLLRKTLLLIALVLALSWLFIFLNKLLSYCQADSYCDILNNPESIKQISLYTTVSFRNLILPTIFFGIAWFGLIFLKTKPILIFILVCVISITGSLQYANKLLYFSDRNFEYPETTPITKLKELAGLNRVWSYGDGYIVRNMLSYYKIYSPEGYEPLYSYRYGMLLNTINTFGKLSKSIHRTDATLSETGQDEKMEENPYRLRLMSVLGIKYLLEHKSNGENELATSSQKFPSRLFSLSWENDKWRIWEYRQALPRVFIASDYIVEKNDQKIIDYLYSPKLNLNKTIILEEYPEINIALLEKTNKLVIPKIIKYDPQAIQIEVDLKQKGLLFLSDNYYPGWKAYVDNKETKIYRANYTFRAIVSPEGKHTIIFKYQPEPFRIGIIISAISLTILIAVYLTKRRFNSSNE